MTLTQEVVDSSDPQSLEPLTSPGEVSRTCTSSSLLNNTLRSACMKAATFIKNLEHVDAVASQHCEGVEEQHYSGNTRVGAQAALVND